MAANSAHAGNGSGWHGSAWRLAAWGAAALLLLLPLVAMQFTDEVNWSPSDFATFGAMLAITGAGFELAVKLTQSRARRITAGAVLATAFLLVWAQGAVGIF